MDPLHALALLATLLVLWWLAAYLVPRVLAEPFRMTVEVLLALVAILTIVLQVLRPLLSRP